MKKIDQYIIDHYKNETGPKIANHFGVTINAIRGRIYKLQKRGDLPSKETNTGQIKKGNIPFNKGMKGLVLNKNGGGKFKKGSIPHNAYPDGHISVREHSDGSVWKYIHFTGRQAHLCHRYLWEQAYGKLSRNDILKFKDGNSLNCTLDNLQKISRKEHIKNNRNETKRIASLKKMSQSDAVYSDKRVASTLVRGDEELKQYLIKNRQDLIELKRVALILRREIKKQKKQNGN